MKLSALAVTLMTATAFVGGPVLAQATMQPVPNPPESGKAMHGKMSKHHRMHKHMHHHMKAKAGAADAAAAPAPAAPQ